MNNLAIDDYDLDDLITFLQSDDKFILLLRAAILSRGNQKLLERIPSKVCEYERTMSNYNHSIKGLLKAAGEYYPG